MTRINKLHLPKMAKLKIFFILVAIPLVSFTALHKYYVSVTEIDFVKSFPGYLWMILKLF